VAANHRPRWLAGPAARTAATGGLFGCGRAMQEVHGRPAERPSTSKATIQPPSEDFRLGFEPCAKRGERCGIGAGGGVFGTGCRSHVRCINERRTSGEVAEA